MMSDAVVRKTDARQQPYRKRAGRDVLCQVFISQATRTFRWPVT
jgi:hypothetical protein